MGAVIDFSSRQFCQSLTYVALCASCVFFSVHLVFFSPSLSLPCVVLRDCQVDIIPQMFSAFWLKPVAKRFGKMQAPVRRQATHIHLCARCGFASKASSLPKPKPKPRLALGVGTPNLSEHFMNPIYFESFQRAMVLAAKGTAGVLAAVAGLALGLHEMKRSLRAEEKLDFWNHASFELRLGGDGESTFSAVPESVVQERLEKLAKVGGFSVDEFQAAARRLRPVEFQVQELEERLAAKEKRLSTEEVRSLRQEEEEALLRRWGERGYLGPDKEVSWGECFYSVWKRQWRSFGASVVMSLSFPHG